MRLSIQTPQRPIVLAAAGLAILALSGLSAVRNPLLGRGEAQTGWLGMSSGLADVPTGALPRLEIEVDPQLHAELVAQASRADGYRRWVPARFGAGGGSFGVEVRIDAADAGQTAGPVWRVHFHGTQRYRGMRDLALAPARDEADTGEVVAADVARKLRLLAAPSGFARLHVNGNDAGVVLWTEGHSKTMLLGIGYDPGPVFAVGVQPGEDSPARVTRVVSARHAFVEAEDARPDALAGKLSRLLELALSAGDVEFARAVPQLLNVDKYIAWNALAWLYGSPSPDLGFGVRWYYDPVTGLLEPFLANFGRRAVSVPTESLAEAHRSPLGARLFRIARYREQRNRVLWGLLNDPGFDVAVAGQRSFGSLFPHIAGAGAPRANVEGPPRPMRTVLAHNADRLRALLSDSARQARRAPLAAGPHVALARLADPVRRSSALTVYADRPADPMPGFVRVPIAMRGGDSLGHRWAIPGSLAFVPASGIPNAIVPAALLATTDSTPRRGLEPAPMRLVADGIAESGLPFARRGDALVLPAGTYTLSQTLIVPADDRIVLEPGVSLRLGPGVSVLTFRALTARGTPTDPIRIGRADPDRPWGAFGVVRASEVSRLEHVAVAGGSRSRVDGIDLAGQIAFNASDLDLRDSEIRGARGGEGLSVKRARFEIAHTRFIDNGLDGLDAEWARGSIRDSAFVGNGDDGLDLAGSQVRVSNSSFRGMRDKAISAGEGSALRVADSEISRSRIALASKEGSRVEVVRTEVFDNEVGFSLYRGKPLFDGGQGRVRGGRFSGNRRDIEIEPGSHLGFESANDEFASALDAVGRWLALPRAVGSLSD